MSSVIIMSHTLRTAWSHVKVSGSSVGVVSQKEFLWVPCQVSQLSCTLHSCWNNPTLTSKCMPSTKRSFMLSVAGEAFSRAVSIQFMCVAKLVAGMSTTFVNLNRLISSSCGVRHRPCFCSMTRSFSTIGIGFIFRLRSMICSSYWMKSVCVLQKLNPYVRLCHLRHSRTVSDHLDHDSSEASAPRPCEQCHLVACRA